MVQLENTPRVASASLNGYYKVARAIISVVDTHFELLTVFDGRRLENWRQCDEQCLPKNTAMGFRTPVPVTG